ncbi:MAG: 50S ribosomal protein L29 [bacterium]|nr:50S ribosomal protein L29 [bacterium]
MARKELDNLRNMTELELNQELVKLKKELFEVRTKIATRQLEDNNASRVLRRRIARIMTVLNEKQVVGN